MKNVTRTDNASTDNAGAGITRADRYTYLLSLRFIIPLLLILMTMLSLLYINYFERQRALKRIQENSVREVTELSIYLQNILEHLLQENRIDFVQEQIGLLGSNINLRLVLLLDENDNIAASNRRKWVGHNIGDAFSKLPGDEKRNLLRSLETARTNRKAGITISGNHASLYGQYPVYSRISGEKLHPLNVSILFMDYDLSRQIDSSNRAILLSSLNYSVFFIIVYIFLGFAIHLIVTRRLTRLTSVVNGFTSGDMAVRADIGGKDEITNLASGLNIMLGKITESRADLQDSKRELLNILESISDGFFTLNREWRYTYLNTNAGRMVKRNSKDLMGKIILDEFPEIVDSPYYQLYNHVMKTGELKHFEEYYPGLERWYAGTVYPYPDGISIYFQDVTERKRAEGAMLQLQQKLSYHLEQTMFGVIEWDREFKVRYWNPAAEKIFGYTREEARNRWAPELLIPKSIHAEIDSVWNDLLNQSGGSYSTNENITKHGKTIICEWFNTPLADNKGNVTGVMSLVSDITERKRIEEQDKTILRTSIDGFIIVNADGKFIDVNDAFCSMTGYTREDLLNIRVQDIEASESPEETRRHIQRIIDNGSDRFESRHKTRAGRIIDVEVSINYIRDSGLFFAFLRDVTDRKKMEIELGQLNRNLQRRVNEEVDKNRWKDQVMFEQSRQISMGELLVSIAHHWRQPLNAISVLAQEIRDANMFHDLTDDYLDSTVKTIMGELQSLSDTIDNFRSFYHAEKEKKRFGIADIVAKSLSLMEGYFKNLNITIEVDIKEDMFVEGYPNEFSRVILCILNNTKDIFEEREIGNGHINIKLQKGSETGKAILSISDDGGGINDDIIDKIFDPYFTTKPKSRGTGLGLYIAKAVVEKNMSGTIKAQNTDGGLEIIIEV
ncbi:MAG: PAS domain S-box protein [Nitrospirae bacterium]|nr:PAS domain S-box protein [Nitrospirota bacterium]